jgi:hypothetical protein
MDGLESLGREKHYSLLQTFPNYISKHNFVDWGRKFAYLLTEQGLSRCRVFYQLKFNRSFSKKTYLELQRDVLIPQGEKAAIFLLFE